MAPMPEKKEKNGKEVLKATISLRKKPAKMGHLHLKRFADTDDLTAGRASCKQCGDPIEKGSMRFVLMLQCHKGYKMAATVHGKDPNCFASHVETEKLSRREEACVKEDVLGIEKSQYAWKLIDDAIARGEDVGERRKAVDPECVHAGLGKSQFEVKDECRESILFKAEPQVQLEPDEKPTT